MEPPERGRSWRSEGMPMPFDQAAFDATVEKLIAILCDLDEFDRPKVKLPSCPKCGEDELGVIHADLILCYFCRWEIRGKPTC